MNRFFLGSCLVAGTAILGACGGSGVSLPVTDIDDAVSAVVEVTGLPPEFYEINATPDLINLFLHDGNGNAVNFVWEDGALRDDTQIAPAEGRTFDAKAMTFTTDVYSNVERELPDSILRAFTITADGPNGELLHRVVIQSERGGQFSVLVDPSGKILGSDPLTGP